MGRKEFHSAFQANHRPAAACTRLGELTVARALAGCAAVGATLLLLQMLVLRYTHTAVSDYFARDGVAADADGGGLYPDAIMQSEWAADVSETDLVHLGLLHKACLTYRDDVVLWSYGVDGKAPAAGEGIIREDDPDVLEKIRQCPDVDIFLPTGIHGHGYCEDSIAYTKYLQSRLLPRWAIDKKYYDKATGKTLGYHDLCPKTPMIFFNHYWDGVPDDPAWPDAKPLYLMPNIEMNELEAKHYWGADVVLCKTAVCARRVRRWYEQEGNPRDARVLYTRHTSSDVATFARASLAPGSAFRAKNFSDVRFVHAIGTSVQKGTKEVLNCWLARPDFPALQIYMDEDVYDGWLKPHYDEQILESQVELHLGRVEADEFGRMVAETAFFLCTSVHEGYGHYINQARASEAVIVTTDIPPMNELLSPASGVLIPAKRVSVDQQLLGGTFKGEHGLRNVEGLTAAIDGESVCEAVEKVLAMTPEQRHAMAVRARKQYYIDLNFFAAKMAELRAFARGDGHLRLRTADGAR